MFYEGWKVNGGEFDVIFFVGVVKLDVIFELFIKTFQYLFFQRFSQVHSKVSILSYGTLIRKNCCTVL